MRWTPRRTSVDDGAAAVAQQRRHGVLAAQEHALDVDLHCQVPHVLGSLDGIVVVGVRDASVVEHDLEVAQLREPQRRARSAYAQASSCDRGAAYLLALFDHSLAVGGLGDVGHQSTGDAAVGADEAHLRRRASERASEGSKHIEE